MVVELSEPATLMPPLALIVVKLIVVPVASKVEPVPVTEIAAEPVTVVLPFRVTLPTEVIAPVERVVVSDSSATVLEELVVAVETLEPVTVIGAFAAVVVSAPVTLAEPEPVIEIPEWPETAAKLIAAPVAVTVEPVPLAVTVPDDVTFPEPVRVTLPVALIAAVERVVPVINTFEVEPVVERVAELVSVPVA